MIANRPSPNLLPSRAVDQYGMTLVDTPRNVGIATRAEDGRSARIRINAREIVRRQRKTAFPVLDGSRVVQEEGTLGLVETPLLTPKMRAQNLNEA